MSFNITFANNELYACDIVYIYIRMDKNIHGAQIFVADTYATHVN